ncbi:hypothetical protein ALO75_200086 [Pseudomonas syringae pv. coryli]|uniref:MFS transporter n=1 Tax=Pseudomonas syringae pv. coryli TaxID=317659 RepID=A0A0P9SSE3_9PSED|nr:hypothetical protein ALO75_200086 [Pseudomonas syringae pv. coryli]
MQQAQEVALHQGVLPLQPVGVEVDLLHLFSSQALPVFENCCPLDQGFVQLLQGRKCLQPFVGREQQDIFTFFFVDLYRFVTQTSGNDKRTVKRHRRILTGTRREAVHAVRLNIRHVFGQAGVAWAQCLRKQAVVVGGHCSQRDEHYALGFQALDLFGDELTAPGFAAIGGCAPVVCQFLAVERFQLLADLIVKQGRGRAVQQRDGGRL